MMKKIIKLYIEEHISLISAVLLSAFAISGSLAWLEKDFDYLYLGILYFFVFSVGMGVHFYKSISLYESILSEVGSEEDFFVSGSSPLARAEKNRLKKIRSVYKEEVNRLQNENENYRFVISRWVHQMKTPLSVLNLMTQENPSVSSEDLIEELDRMEYLLNQILHLIRMENIKNDFIVERCQLASLVKSVVNEQKNYFIQNEVFPKMDIHDSIYVYTDKKWFSFAVQQFLNNAVKYSSSGQSIQIAGSCENEHAILKIQDFGSGICAEDQPRIFNFCYTGNNGREKQKESSGLGLYIAKNILDYLEHEIVMRSEQGKGTTFQIYMRTGNTER
jgi:Signal transduction histidine kinase|nr:sensor histidine kinase [uncultured Schaedlerella sp.]